MFAPIFPLLIRIEENCLLMLIRINQQSHGGELKIYLIIPAYNEQERIRQTLEDYCGTLSRNYKEDACIAVISDSNDRTNEIVSKYAKGRNVKLLKNRIKRGKGAALLKGFELACGDRNAEIVGFVDADPSITGSEIVRLIERLRESDADGVIASRYVKGSKLIGRQRPARYFASRGYNLLVRLLFGFKYHDTQCGAKFFKKRALCSILRTLALTDMSFDLDLLYEMRQRGFRVEEVPITYRWINQGSSLRLNKQVPQMFMVAIGYRIIKSPLNAIVPPSVKGAVYNFFRGW
jgi:glycosyltransferase involved in cell wall biosynthesis